MDDLKKYSKLCFICINYIFIDIFNVVSPSAWWGIGKHCTSHVQSPQFGPELGLLSVWSLYACSPLVIQVFSFPSTSSKHTCYSKLNRFYYLCQLSMLSIWQRRSLYLSVISSAIWCFVSCCAGASFIWRYQLEKKKWMDVLHLSTLYRCDITVSLFYTGASFIWGKQHERN